MIKWSLFIAITFIVGLALTGCANQRDLVSETQARKAEDRYLMDKVLENGNADGLHKNFFAKELETINAKVNYLELLTKPHGEDGLGEDPLAFERASKLAQDETDAKYCAEGHDKGDEFWIKIFCKKSVAQPKKQGRR